MTHDHNHTDPEQAALAALIARLAQRDPVQAAALRQAGMIMASLDAALAPHGLVPLHDDPQRAAQDAAQVSENLGEAGYTVEAHYQHKNVPGSSDHQPLVHRVCVARTAGAARL